MELLGIEWIWRGDFHVISPLTSMSSDFQFCQNPPHQKKNKVQLAAGWFLLHEDCKKTLQ